MKGKFITFEGCEGVGKSTQLELLKEYFSAAGIDGIFTREPGGCEISEKIRAVILDKNHDGMFDETELLLYAAARFQHTKEVIIPALNAGRTVVCDRYIDSTTAYQAYARGLDKARVDRLNEFAMGGAVIDCTVFLDALPFANTKRKADDRLELAGADFHERVYIGFKELAGNNARFITVKTHSDKLVTHQEIIDKLKERKLI